MPYLDNILINRGTNYGISLRRTAVRDGDPAIKDGKRMSCAFTHSGIAKLSAPQPQEDLLTNEIIDIVCDVSNRLERVEGAEINISSGADSPTARIEFDLAIPTAALPYLIKRISESCPPARTSPCYTPDLWCLK